MMKRTLCGRTGENRASSRRFVTGCHPQRPTCDRAPAARALARPLLFRLSVLDRIQKAPLVSAALVVLLVVTVIGWRAGSAGLRTASMQNVRADLADSGLIFTVDFQLGSAWQQLAFARVQEDARKQFRAIMRSKRRYMVESTVAREGLRAEFAYTINRLAEAEIVEQVQFPRFDLF